MCLRITRGVANWYASRSDSYVSPFTRGMRRTSPQARARARILTDDEIGILWKAAEANGTFGAFLLIALLSVQRKDKVVTMKWSDISLDGVWTIPAERSREGHGGRAGAAAARRRHHPGPSETWSTIRLCSPVAVEARSTASARPRPRSIANCLRTCRLGLSTICAEPRAR